MKHIFIFHHSSKFNLRELQARLFSICSFLQYDFQIVEVGSIFELKNVAKQYKNEDAIVYAVGGDQEMHYLLNGLIGGTAKLGVLPLGYELDTYLNLEQYASSEVNANVMRVNERYGLNFFSVGLDAEVVKKMDETSGSYLASYLTTFPFYRNQVMGVDDFYEKNCFLSVCNGPFYRGCEVSHATLHSPCVRVYIGGDMNQLERLFFFFQVLLGKHEFNSQVRVYDTDYHMRIEGMNSLVGHFDGELMEEQIFDIIPCAEKVTLVNNRALIRELKK